MENRWQFLEFESMGVHDRERAYSKFWLSEEGLIRKGDLTTLLW